MDSDSDLTADDRSTGVATEPAVYLRRAPTPEEHTLAEQLGSHDGDHVPMHMLAKLAVRQHRNTLWIGKFENVRRQISRRALAVAGMLVAQLAAGGGYWLHVHDAAIAERESFIEYRASTDRTIGELRTDIRELRALLTATLHRLGVVMPSDQGGDIDDYRDPPDKSAMIQMPFGIGSPALAGSVGP